MACGVVLVLVGRLPSFIAFGVRLIAQPLNYSGSIAGQSSDVFGLRKQSPGLSLFSFLSLGPSSQSTTTVRPNLISLVSPRSSSRAPGSYPEPDPGSRHRWVGNIPKHLQNVSFLLIGLLSLFFLDRPITIGWTEYPPNLIQ